MWSPCHTHTKPTGYPSIQIVWVWHGPTWVWHRLAYAVCRRYWGHILYCSMEMDFIDGQLRSAYAGWTALGLHSTHAGSSTISATSQNSILFSRQMQKWVRRSACSKTDISLDPRDLQKWFTYQNLQDLIRETTVVFSTRPAQWQFFKQWAITQVWLWGRGPRVTLSLDLRVLQKWFTSECIEICRIQTGKLVACSLYDLLKEYICKNHQNLDLWLTDSELNSQSQAQGLKKVICQICYLSCLRAFHLKMNGGGVGKKNWTGLVSVRKKQAS